MARGSLVCVGTGLKMAGHISVLSRSYIEHADLVFTLMPDVHTQAWIERVNSSVVNLQQFYAQGGEIKSRRQTYRQMVDAILQSVRAGKQVVGAFYGHPGVFACVPHMAIAQAKSEGFAAHMEPGISAEACLWADLGIDPGDYGHQSVEASQFMFFNYQPDVTAYLLLWQIALAGEHTLTKFNTTEARLQILVEHMLQWYPADHRVAIYEASNLPVLPPRIDWLKLEQLPFARLTAASTLLVPPSKTKEYNLTLLQKLGITPADMG
ncbi:SAM-dependent methyltransferase [Shewanella sp. GXUN23E]|uniref:SAM-dependent methyltransferase n=1 Tax=Shewanella sp. GXUN23E TaxID=3422498 RepID=UPI003D7D546A